VERVGFPSTQVDVAVPEAELQLNLAATLSRLIPLWRHAVWFVLVFAAFAGYASIRLDVQQLRKDLHRNVRAQREAHILNDRLRLEQDARRQAATMEAVATELQLDHSAKVVWLRSGR
jgi:hypothetical protein